MSLGNKKPPGKKEQLAIQARLDRHFALMERFVAEGMGKDAASKKAYRIVTNKELIDI